MHVMFRLPCLTGVLLLAATPFARAESPMPDPIAPAVIGRPLHEIRPTRPVRPKPMAVKPKRPKQVAARPKAAPKAAAAATAAVVVPAAVQSTPTPDRVAKQALDDRVDANVHAANDVGQGSNMGRKALAPGAYIGSRHQALVRKYYAANPAAVEGPPWQIGEPVPAKAKLTGVPDDLRAALPRVPPGHQYVQVDGEVVLVAMQSRMVVDGVSREAR